MKLNERRIFGPGWRGVFLDLNREHVLEESIFYSDSTSQDNLDATDQRNDIHVSTRLLPQSLRNLKVSSHISYFWPQELGKVSIQLTPERCRCFNDIRTGDKGEYYYLETAIAFVLKGLTVYYEFFLHKTGRWPKNFDFSVDLEEYGSDILVDRGLFDANGAFQLHNCT